ncbi:MAG: hypothetical protein ACOX9B_03530 [Candidatus Xenobium sp.]
MANDPDYRRYDRGMARAEDEAHDEAKDHRDGESRRNSELVIQASIHKKPEKGGYCQTA